MEKPKVIFKENELTELLTQPSVITDTIVYIMNHLEELPKNIGTIGVAKNYMLGVFGIQYQQGIYTGYRICISKNKMITSDIGYPISNMCKTNIDCNMNYIVSLRTLKHYRDRA